MSIVRSVCTSAPCKIILFGEHAVAYGEPALAIAIEPRTRVHLTLSDCLQLNCHYRIENFRQRINSEESLSLVRSIVSHFGYNNITANIETGFPIGSGLGTSASVTVALIAALKLLCGELRQLSTNDLFSIRDLAHEFEQVTHAGRASGIDDTTCTFGGVIYFKSSQLFERLEDMEPPDFLLIYSGKPKNTGAITRFVGKRIQTYGGIQSHVISAIGEICKQAIVALDNRDLEELKLLVNWNQALLRILGASNERIDDIVNRSHLHGMAAKLTGGGQGGCVIATPSKQLQDLETVFGNNMKARLLSYQLDLDGVAIESIRCF